MTDRECCRTNEECNCPCTLLLDIQSLCCGYFCFFNNQWEQIRCMITHFTPLIHTHVRGLNTNYWLDAALDVFLVNISRRSSFVQTIGDLRFVSTTRGYEPPRSSSEQLFNDLTWIRNVNRASWLIQRCGKRTRFGQHIVIKQKKSAWVLLALALIRDESTKLWWIDLWMLDGPVNVSYIDSSVRANGTYRRYLD